MFPEFVVPLTPQDLPADETYEQINASLSALQQASDGVFARIQNAVEDSRGMLSRLCDQSYVCSSNPLISRQSSTHGMGKSFLYPELFSISNKISCIYAYSTI